ncbi:MAG TPA: MotA/TolQ/ExbB proton channel family protein [Myxococcota bacterium]|nr:MotA/TolQ/ExbB proton channel family protein [Myxococcota bacterium]
MTAAAGAQSTFDAAAVLHMLWQGRLTVIPLVGCSFIAIAIVFAQVFRLRGIDKRSRELTRSVVDAIVKHDIVTARSLCESGKTPLAGIFLEGLRWRNIALEDLNAVLATSRAEAITELKRGLWVLGTIGSLAPFIGLFGTVWGILRSFHDMATQGSGGFAVVASGISEALVATAAGLLVAIIALAFFNWLQVRNNAVSGLFSRSCERLVQALLYVESASPAPSYEDEKPSEVRHGRPLPA